MDDHEKMTSDALWLRAMADLIALEDRAIADPALTGLISIMREMMDARTTK